MKLNASRSLHLSLQAKVISTFSKYFSVGLSSPFNFLMLLNNGWHQIRILTQVSNSIYERKLYPYSYCTQWSQQSHLFRNCAERSLPVCVSDRARAQSCAVNLHYEFIDVYRSVWASNSSFIGKPTDLYSCMHVHAHVEIQCCGKWCCLCCKCKILNTSVPAVQGPRC